MTEDEARSWASKHVPRETIARLDRFAALLHNEAGRQNLVATSSLDRLWSRHIVDSLQLAKLAADKPGPWLDVGSGAGFPGLVIALAERRDMVLVEPRALRAEFLRGAVHAFELTGQVRVAACKVEAINLDTPPSIVSARAVAPLEKLLYMGAAVADRGTRWLLPKGRSAAEEVARATGAWHGDFRMVPSITDPDAAIVVAIDVHPRTRR